MNCSYLFALPGRVGGRGLSTSPSRSQLASPAAGSRPGAGGAVQLSTLGGGSGGSANMSYSPLGAGGLNSAYGALSTGGPVLAGRRGPLGFGDAGGPPPLGGLGGRPAASTAGGAGDEQAAAKATAAAAALQNLSDFDALHGLLATQAGFFEALAAAAAQASAAMQAVVKSAAAGRMPSARVRGGARDPFAPGTAAGESPEAARQRAEALLTYVMGICTNLARSPLARFRILSSPSLVAAIAAGIASAHRELQQASLAAAVHLMVNSAAAAAAGAAGLPPALEVGWPEGGPPEPEASHSPTDRSGQRPGDAAARTPTVIKSLSDLPLGRDGDSFAFPPPSLASMLEGAAGGVPAGEPATARAAAAAAAAGGHARSRSGSRGAMPAAPMPALPAGAGGGSVWGASDGVLNSLRQALSGGEVAEALLALMASSIDRSTKHMAGWVLGQCGAPPAVQPAKQQQLA